MIKYYAWLNDIYLIDDVVSETNHYITTATNNRLKKMTQDSAIFDTFEEAKEWLINTNQIKMNNIFDQVKRMSDRIEEIKNIKVPKRRW